MSIGVIIPAAGSGTRMGGAHKPFLEILGKPLLQYCLEAFFQVEGVRVVVVALPEQLSGNHESWLQDERIRLVAGGAQRADSVKAALAVMPADVSTIVIHDAARPVINANDVRKLLAAVSSTDSATLAVPVTDTLHRANADQLIVDTPDRSQFWRALTPQAFPRKILEQAYQQVVDASHASDEAGLVARAGFNVRVVPGDASNIKVTMPADVPLAEALLRSRA